MAGSLHLRIDASEFAEWSRRASDRLLDLEPSLARKVLHQLFGSISRESSGLSLVSLPAAPGAGDDVIRLALVGLDELFAAAMTAAELETRSCHNGSPGSVD